MTNELMIASIDIYRYKMNHISALKKIELGKSLIYYWGAHSWRVDEGGTLLEGR